MSSWLPALVSLGGAVLAFFGARLGVRAEAVATRQRDDQARREEWGRRFTTALLLIADTSERQQVIGKALLSELLDSELASVADKQMASRVFAADMERLTRSATVRRGAGTLDDAQPAEDDECVDQERRT